MGKKEARMNQIVQLLNEHGGQVLVCDLASALSVSEMTVRRDLDEMQEKHILERKHGYAVLSTNISGTKIENIESDYALLNESTKHIEEKRRIGGYASSMIEEDDVIILDNGSTTDQVAHFIDGTKKLTVGCFNLNIANRLFLHNKIDIHLAGGYFHRKDNMFESKEGVEYIKGFRANKVFLSASGVHDKLGMTCASHYEVPVKQAIIATALKKILLVDSSKFGTVKTVFFAPISYVDMIITDTGISEEWKSIITELRIELKLV